MFNHILFVCIGNICRSPSAEYWAKQQLNQEGIRIESAGLQAVVGAGIAPQAEIILEKYGVDCSQHRARQLELEHIAAAGIIFVMEAWQEDDVLQRFPMARGKLFTLGKWIDEEIEDPYRKSQAVFDKTFELVKQGWSSWQERLWPS